MKRGDLVTIALPGDYGEPRPALVIQSDLFEAHPLVTVLPVTSELREAPLFPVRVDPADVNGLRRACDMMVDKPQTIARAKAGQPIGRLEDETLIAVNRALAVYPGFA